MVVVAVAALALPATDAPTEAMRPEDARRVHEAVEASLDDGEIAVAWCLTIDVAGPENVRYLAHRAGGGADGSDAPMMWVAIGMLRASMQVAEQQTIESTVDLDDDDGNDEEDGEKDGP